MHIIEEVFGNDRFDDENNERAENRPDIRHESAE